MGDITVPPHEREVVSEARREISGRKKRADYVLRINRVEKMIWEAKKPSEPLEKHAFQVQNYVYNSGRGVYVGVLTDFERLLIYVVGAKPNRARPAEYIRIYSFRDYATTKADELWNLLSRDAVANGSLDRLVMAVPKARPRAGRQQWLVPPKRREVDEEFLDLLDDFRAKLARSLLHTNPKFPWDDHRITAAVQKIIDRILFTRICEDRDIDTGLPLYRYLEEWRKRGEHEGALYPSLVGHFRTLRPLFNGGLFGKKGEEDHFSESLSVDDAVLADFLEELCAEDSTWLFNRIPVEILGSVYERFLGKVITRSGRVVPKPEVRKAGGVYYTPQYVVNYIVEQTVGRLLQGKTPIEVGTIKVLDPACGSGSFLIRAFERICEYHIEWLMKHARDRTAENCWIDERKDLHLTAGAKRHILLNNMHGIDIDEQAVEVAQLSLYLKTLEGETRSTLDRQRPLFKGETLLPDLSKNVRWGNSLIGPDFYKGQQMGLLGEREKYHINAFDWNDEKAGFGTIMKGGGFDAVIGNPPYIPIELMTGHERSYFQRKFPELERKFDSAAAFIAICLDRLKQNGLLAFISSVTWQTGENYKRLREKIFKHGSVDRIVNLPFDVFKDAYVDTGVYVLGRQPQDHYLIFQFPKKKQITPDLADIAYRRVPTSASCAPDYRIILDPGANQILERIHKEVPTCSLGEVTTSTQGLAGNMYNSSATSRGKDWMRYLEKGQVHRYELVLENIGYVSMSDKESLRPFYEAKPKLLIRRVISRQDRLLATFSDKALVTKKDINPFVVSASNWNPFFLLGIINSALFSYLYMNTSSIAAKDDFRQTTLAELRRLPIRTIDFSDKKDKARHDRVVELVERMLDLHKKLPAAKTPHEKDRLEREISATDKVIDALVYELYGLTEEEIKIVEREGK